MWVGAATFLPSLGRWTIDPLALLVAAALIGGVHCLLVAVDVRALRVALRALPDLDLGLGPITRTEKASGYRTKPTIESVSDPTAARVALTGALIGDAVALLPIVAAGAILALGSFVFPHP